MLWLLIKLKENAQKEIEVRLTVNNLSARLQDLFCCFTKQVSEAVLNLARETYVNSTCTCKCSIGLRNYFQHWQTDTECTCLVAGENDTGNEWLF